MSVEADLSDGGRVSGHRDDWWLERRFAGWGGRGASRIHSCGEAWSGGKQEDGRMLPQTAYSTTGGSGRVGWGRTIFEGGGRCESSAGGKSRCGRTQSAYKVFRLKFPLRNLVGEIVTVVGMRHSVLPGI